MILLNLLQLQAPRITRKILQEFQENIGKSGPKTQAGLISHVPKKEEAHERCAEVRTSIPAEGHRVARGRRPLREFEITTGNRASMSYAPLSHSRKGGSLSVNFNDLSISEVHSEQGARSVQVVGNGILLHYELKKPKVNFLCLYQWFGLSGMSKTLQPTPSAYVSGIHCSHALRTFVFVHESMHGYLSGSADLLEWRGGGCHRGATGVPTGVPQGCKARRLESCLHCRPGISA